MPSWRLETKACLVTGAGSGISRAIATRFAAEGSMLALDIDGAAAARTADDIGSAGGRGADIQADVTRSEDTERAAGAAWPGFGRIDVLVANAGISAAGVLHETPPRTWDRVFDINVRGTYLTCEAVDPADDRAAERHGDHHVVGHRRDRAAEPGRVRRIQGRPAGPGQIDGGRLRQVRHPGQGPGCRERSSPRYSTRCSARARRPRGGDRRHQGPPVTGALGQPEDVANAAVFLASDESSFVLGTGLVIDGGSSGGR